MTMTYGSVCSGIEAATVAWQGLGWEPSWFSEIEPFPSAVLAHHYPDVPNTGDMLQLPRKILAGEVHAPDVLCGGTPCQGFSVAGLRGSLDDDRSNLSLTFCEIANAIDQVRQLRGEQPSIIFWENVPGVLNTKDNAFGCLLGELAGETCELQPPGGATKWSNAGCVFGPQRAVAWRVFDAQYFGVAQRRRRVFLVASARTDFNPSEILFEFEGVRRGIKPSRAQGQEAAPHAGSSPTGRGRSAVSYCGTQNDAMRDAGEEIAPTLRAGSNGGAVNPVVSTGFRMSAFGQYEDDDSASTMKARDYKDATDLVVQPPIAFAQNTRDEVQPYLLFEPRSADGVPRVTPDQSLCPTLNTMSGGQREPCIAFNSRQDPVSGDLPGALDTCSPQAQAVVLPLNSMTMQGRPSDDLRPRMGSGIGDPDDPQNTLSSNHHHAVAVLNPPTYQVRRLTPVECERLQGFPDNYTRIPWAGKPADQCPDGHRYKALGNSWAVPNVRWIGARINAALFSRAPTNSSILSPTSVEGL